jgi:hypothetical protein
VLENVRHFFEAEKPVALAQILPAVDVLDVLGTDVEHAEPATAG